MRNSKIILRPFFDAIEIKETFGKIVPLTRPKENCVNTPISHKRATKSNKSEKGLSAENEANEQHPWCVQTAFESGN